MIPDAVRLVPVGRMPLFRMEDLAARLSRRVRIPCQVDGTVRITPPLLSDRDQGDADGLLGHLETSVAGPREIAVAVVAVDLAIPIFTFVFGRARQGGQAAVVSLARLDPAFYGLPADDELLAQRALVEVVHELGHVASLVHCPDAACIMSFAGSVERVDVRGTDFCDSCVPRLPDWIVAPQRRG